MNKKYLKKKVDLIVKVIIHNNYKINYEKIIKIKDKKSKSRSKSKNKMQGIYIKPKNLIIFLS